MTLQEISQTVYAQMAVHVPLCMTQEPKRILLLGDFLEKAVFDELDRHEKSFEAIALAARPVHFALPDWAKWREGAVGALIDTLDTSFDIIIDLRSQTPNREEIRVLLEKLTVDGVMVRGFAKLQAETLRLFESCRYVTPYGLSSLIAADGALSGFILASKRLHPTADLKIQKADMLEGCSYYSVDIHEAAFALPPMLLEQFDDALKL